MAHEERTELLAQLRQTCFNDEDVATLTPWEELSIEELRTVAILLNDEMVLLLNAQEGARGHCYLLTTLYEHIIRNTRARNPLTGSLITDRQRQNIMTAWSRLPLQDDGETDPDVLVADGVFVNALGLTVMRLQERQAELEEQMRQQDDRVSAFQEQTLLWDARVSAFQVQISAFRERMRQYDAARAATG